VNVNVTLLFARSRYDEVIDAYLTGIERRAATGEAVDTIASVASFFVSRIDAKADEELPDRSPVRGRVAVANAKLTPRGRDGEAGANPVSSGADSRRPSEADADRALGAAGGRGCGGAPGCRTGRGNGSSRTAAC
jgi:hypothetical protein